MTNIYLVRHAEAEGNVYRRIQGQYNSNITELGQKQKEAVARRFAHMDIAGVVCSDLFRAKCTAQAIARSHQLKVIERITLREINMGCWENKPWGNLNRQYPEEMKNFIYNIENFSVTGSENVCDVQKRIKKEIIAIGEEFEGKNVVVVCHGTAINAFLADLLGVTCANIKSKFGSGDNTSVSLLQYEEGKLNLVFCHDATHLSADISTYERQKKWRNTTSQMDGTYFTELVTEDLRRFSDYDEKKVASIIKDSINKTKVMIDKNYVGMIFLREGSESNTGRIGYCWIEPQYRRQRIGVQLIGHAVSFFRDSGKCRIEIVIEDKEQDSIVFFQKSGFKITDCAKASTRMDFNIRQDVWERES